MIFKKNISTAAPADIKTDESKVEQGKQEIEDLI